MENGFDKKTIEDFVKTIREIVIDTVNNINSNTERYYNGIVTEISEDGTLATVDIGDMVLEGIPNKSGEELFIADKTTGSHASFVRVYTTTNTMTDAYIGIKLG